MAHRVSEPLNVSEKSASLRSGGSRQTADNGSDTDSTASVDSDSREFRSTVYAREEFRVVGGENVMYVGEAQAASE